MAPAGCAYFSMTASVLRRVATAPEKSAYSTKNANPRHRVTASQGVPGVGAGFISNRRTIKIATAGVIGKMERSFTVQLQKEAKQKVPPTHSNSRLEFASRCCQVSAAASAKIANPAVIQNAI